MQLLERCGILGAVVLLSGTAYASSYTLEKITGRFHGQPTSNVQVLGLTSAGRLALNVYGPKGRAPEHSETFNVLSTDPHYKRLVPPVVAGTTVLSTMLQGMTSNGIIFGNYTTQTGDNPTVVHGFVLSHGQWTTYDNPNASYSSVGSVSTNGRYVVDGGTLYQDGLPVSLNTSALPNFKSIAYLLVANGGQLAGGYVTPNQNNLPPFPFIGSNATLKPFNPMQSQQCGIYNLSEDGTTVVGSCAEADNTSEGFIYRQGTTQLVSIPGFDEVYVQAINAAGDVAGVAERTRSGQDEFFVQAAAGTLTTIPLPYGENLPGGDVVSAIDPARNLTANTNFNGANYIHQ